MLRCVTLEVMVGCVCVCVCVCVCGLFQKETEQHHSSSWPICHQVVNSHLSIICQQIVDILLSPKVPLHKAIKGYMIENLLFPLAHYQMNSVSQMMND